MAVGKCDFCSSPTGPGKQSYRARSQIFLLTPGVTYDGGEQWVACAECSALIEGEEWKALMDQAKLINPGLRLAAQAGKLDELVEVISRAWGGIFGQPPEVFQKGDAA